MYLKRPCMLSMPYQSLVRCALCSMRCSIRPDRHFCDNKGVACLRLAGPPIARINCVQSSLKYGLHRTRFQHRLPLQLQVVEILLCGVVWIRVPDAFIYLAGARTLMAQHLRGRRRAHGCIKGGQDGGVCLVSVIDVHVDRCWARMVNVLLEVKEQC